jgi:hypothetical protein
MEAGEGRGAAWRQQMKGAAWKQQQAAGGQLLTGITAGGQGSDEGLLMPGYYAVQ